MSNIWLAVGSAAGLGVMTAISPCMLATTVVAISFIARRIGAPHYVLLSGACFVAAQALTYMAMAGLLVGGLLSAPLLSQWLRIHMIQALGPLLVLSAPFLLGLIEVPAGRGRMKRWAQGLAQTGGLGAAALLGMIFAMSFCPTTAALFFGGLVPLAVAHESALFLPFCYAVGVSGPVAVFALILAFAANRVGRLFTNVSRAEWWARRATGGLFLALGVYFTLDYTLNVF